MAGTFDQCFHNVPLTERCEKCPMGIREIFTMNQLTGYMTRHTLPDKSAEQPAQANEPRAIIQHFAIAMERKLAANDGVKGDFRDDSEWNHVMYAKQEMKELKQALAAYRIAQVRVLQFAGFPDTVPGMDVARVAVEQAKAQLIEARQAVLDECADVANYVMFAAGVIGALPVTDERGR